MAEIMVYAAQHMQVLQYILFFEVTYSESRFHTSYQTW